MSRGPAQLVLAVAGAIWDGSRCIQNRWLGCRMLLWAYSVARRNLFRSLIGTSAGDRPRSTDDERVVGRRRQSHRGEKFEYQFHSHVRPASAENARL
jgi:hypothetical protein